MITEEASAVGRFADAIVDYVARDTQVDRAEAEIGQRLERLLDGGADARQLLEFITLEYRGILVASSTAAVLAAAGLANGQPKVLRAPRGGCNSTDVDLLRR